MLRLPQITCSSQLYSDYLACVAAHAGAYINPEDYLTPENLDASNQQVSKADPGLMTVLAGGTALFKGSKAGVVGALAIATLEVSAATCVNKTCTALVYH